jgi:hypothetical protein
MVPFRPAALVLVVVGCLIAPAAAHAQATRTWVSGVGDDVNPCSRTAPCKTFAGAITKTAAGGEVTALDPGGFGPVTITKSITLSGGGLASIVASGTNGITVNDGSGGAPGTIRVVIRNLSIHDAGLAGINVLSAAAVTIDGVSIVKSVDGIKVASSSGARVDVAVNRSTISDGGDGIEALAGLVTVNDSVIVNNTGTGVLGKGSATISVENSQLNSNGVALQADGSSIVRISNNGFYNNRAAFACGTGILSSAGNNRKAGNVGGGVPVCVPNASIVVQ